MKKPRATIYVSVDESCEMARVHTRIGTLPKGTKQYDFGMLGNFWDFHPGCHAMHQFGDFRGYNSLANAIELFLLRKGYEVTRAPVNNNWKYR